MLSKYLSKLRVERVMSEAAKTTAISNLAENWKYEEQKLSKEFLFPTYEGANNFLLRFNDYCSKTNRKPRWRNVYNTITISLQDTEFDDVTTKEIEVAEYLDQVYDVTVNFDELMLKSKFNVSEIMLPKVRRQ